MMKIQCGFCNHREETSMGFFAKVIGAALPAGGYWVWVTYFFAGTGLAMPIVIAMITGGIALLAFQNEIVAWLSNNYDCPNCASSDWHVVGE